MNLDQLIVLLPCRSLEDFSLHRDSIEAEQLLGAWSALWHPALVARAQTVPSWIAAEEPPENPSKCLIVIPDCSRVLLPGDWMQKAQQAGAGLVCNKGSRAEMVAACLEQVEGFPADIDPDLVADFLALGFGHLIVELLTRQLRYMSNLDEESFRNEGLAAAEEAAKGNVESARGRLEAAFQLLHEAREYFYPVEAHLLDLTLVAPTTLGESLRAELAGGPPTNLLLSGHVVEQMARQQPQTFRAVAAAVEQRSVGIVGGEYAEMALPLLGPEAIRYQLQRGVDACRTQLGRRPTIFGRRRFGLTPVLPQILRHLGFEGALHSTLDDGRFPAGNQSRIQWEGLDGTTIEALARIPIDISRADAFLRLPEKLGDTMDLDHVATVVLAHWPGQSSPWYDDLRRIASYSSVVGTFTTIETYFQETGLTGQQTLYRADQYRSPYLRQDVGGGKPDPISRWVRYHGRRAVFEAAQNLETLSALLRGGAEAVAGQLPTAEQFMAQVEGSIETDAAEAAELDRQLQGRLEASLTAFSQSLGGTGPSTAAATGEGILVANPSSAPRRMCLETADLAKAPDTGGVVRAAHTSAAKTAVVLDVPAMGFAWLGPGSGPSPPVSAEKPKGRRRRGTPTEEPPLAEELSLRNDFFKIAIDPHTGAMASISDYHSRGARLAQQIALRMPPAGSRQRGEDAEYSIMAADEIVVTSPGPVFGEIVCRGRLVDRQARRLAGYTQTTRVWRGSRLIELQIDLDVEQLPAADPWNSYYAARFAWGDATANLYRSVNLANVPTDVVQLEAPHFIDVRSDKVRTTLLTGGLPYHRRFGLRKLDTLLVVQGETARSFRLGIGIDLPHPVPAALGFLAPPTVEPNRPCPPTPAGWLFHLDARNVTATHWEPLVGEDGVAGFRVRLLETDGRRAELGLRCFRSVASAARIEPGEAEPLELPVDDDRVSIDIGPHQWVEVEARFGV